MSSARQIMSRAWRTPARSTLTCFYAGGDRTRLIRSIRQASTATTSPSTSSVAAKSTPPPSTSRPATTYASRQAAAPASKPAYSTTPSPSPSSSSSSSSAPPTTTAKPTSNVKAQPPPHDLTTGLQDPLPEITSSPSSSPDGTPVDWSRSFHGLSTTAFTREASTILMEPLSPADVEVKPDGIIYLPEIKYRRILNRAFGPGAWGLAPRGETIVTQRSVTREYGLVVHGRLVSIARGEQQYFDPEGIPTATEGCKSNALMRCCKDLGIASELWDPRFIREFMSKHAKEVWVEHMTTKRKKKIHMRKDVQNIPYPFVAAKAS